jgi:hypothetical protein
MPPTGTTTTTQARDEPVPDKLATEPTHAVWTFPRLAALHSGRSAASASAPPAALLPAEHPYSQLWTATRTQVLALADRTQKRKRMEEARELAKRLELDELREQAQRRAAADTAQSEQQEHELNEARRAERERRATMSKTVSLNSDF